MFRFVLFFFFLVNITNSYAQSQHDISHLEFLGIPITGGLDDFVSNILKLDRGFSIYKANRLNDFDGFTSTELRGGSFWKFKDCNMHVRFHNKIGYVTSIIVNAEINKGTEEHYYEDIILSYDKKYGEHSESEDDGWVYYKWWAGNDGRIIVTEVKKYSFISIKYEDFPEALIEAEKELKELLYKGHSEDVDL